MNARKLTPYDRGTRLEPQLWPLGDDPDSYGRVDFDNDESATVLTAYVEREGDGYAMHVAGMAEPLSLVVDGGGRVVPVDAELCAGIDELLDMARRGREDFEHQASYGDYTAEDRAAADRRWLLAQKVAELLRRLVEEEVPIRHARDILEALADAQDSDLAEIEITPTGLGLHWPKLDADVYVPALMQGVFGTKRWMAAQLGASGGKASTPAKASAARANGSRGGRPRKHA